MFKETTYQQNPFSMTEKSRIDYVERDLPSVDDLVGMEVEVALFEPFVTRAIVVGHSFDKSHLFLRDVQNQFTAKMDLREFYSKCASTRLSRELEDNGIVKITKDPDNKIVIVRTVFNQTEEDRKYLRYCQEMGRDLGDVEVPQQRNPELKLISGPSDFEDDNSDLLF